MLQTQQPKEPVGRVPDQSAQQVETTTTGQPNDHDETQVMSLQEPILVNIILEMRQILLVKCLGMLVVENQEVMGRGKMSEVRNGRRLEDLDLVRLSLWPRERKWGLFLERVRRLALISSFWVIIWFSL